jgi:hypothetical protein
MLSTELHAKRLEILKDIVPSGRRFALLSVPETNVPAQVQAIADAATALGVELQTVDVRAPADLAPAFASFRAGGAEGIDVLFLAGAFRRPRRARPTRLAYLIRQLRVARPVAETGCLASYGYRSSERLWTRL